MEFDQRLQTGSSALPTQGTVLFQSCARRLYSHFFNLMSEARRHGDCSQSKGCGRGLARSLSKIRSAIFKGSSKFTEALNRDIHLWAPYWNSERSAHNFEFRLVACSLTDTFLYIRAGQLEPTGGPRNSLRIGLRATLVYTYIEMGGELNSLERRYLQSVSFTKTTVE
jgi:hypothetical protein